jgi:hypothetical protein
MERVLQLLCESERQLVDSRVLVVNTCAHTSREVCGGVPVTRAATLARIGSVGVSPALALELARTPADVTVVHEPNPSRWSLTRSPAGVARWWSTSTARSCARNGSIS